MIAEVCSQWSHAYAASPLFGVDCCWCCPVSVSSCLAGDTQPRLSCCQRTGVLLCHTVTVTHTRHCHCGRASHTPARPSHDSGPLPLLLTINAPRCCMPWQQQPSPGFGLWTTGASRMVIVLLQLHFHAPWVCAVLLRQLSLLQTRGRGGTIA